jgi:hypothetical protein
MFISCIGNTKAACSEVKKVSRPYCCNVYEEISFLRTIKLDSFKYECN